MDKIEIWPGPMEGIGRREFVNAVSALKLVDRWITPFIRLTESVPSAGKLTDFVRPYLDSGLPVTVQLMGNDPRLLGKCGSFLQTLPGVEGINLNMGCPSNRVVHNNSGGAMLKHPEKIADFCAEVASFLKPGKLSVKLRTGFASPEDMEIFIPALSAQQCISKIFLHYRTVKESYSPLPRQYRDERLKHAAALCRNIPLIVNGDIDSYHDAAGLIRLTGAAGVMIARSWLKDPYLLLRLNGKSGILPEEGRDKFFTQLRNSGVKGGALLEMAKMMWGSSHPRFRNLIDEVNFSG